MTVREYQPGAKVRIAVPSPDVDQHEYTVIDTALGLRADGRTVPDPPKLILSTGDGRRFVISAGDVRPA